MVPGELLKVHNSLFNPQRYGARSPPQGAQQPVQPSRQNIFQNVELFSVFDARPQIPNKLPISLKKKDHEWFEAFGGSGGHRNIAA